MKIIESINSNLFPPGINEGLLKRVHHADEAYNIILLQANYVRQYFSRNIELFFWFSLGNLRRFLILVTSWLQATLLNMKSCTMQTSIVALLQRHFIVCANKNFGLSLNVKMFLFRRLFC